MHMGIEVSGTELEILHIAAVSQYMRAPCSTLRQ